MAGNSGIANIAKGTDCRTTKHMYLWGVKKIPMENTIPSNIQKYADSSREITVMGIINLTDDSFFAGSRYLSPDGDVDEDALLHKAEKMIKDGAGVLDLGACSTRPGSEPVGIEEEWRRLKKALLPLKKAFPEVGISVDTYFSEVVERVHETIGKFTVNDISAGEDDPLMLPTVGRLGLPYIAMHKRGTPSSMQEMTDYGDGKNAVVDAVKEYFLEFSGKAERHAVKDWILDPGFGFAKTTEQNYTLLRNLPLLRIPGRKILVGISRKSMIYRPLGLTPEEVLPQTQALHMAALSLGADILRVHDVAETVRTVALYRLLY